MKILRSHTESCSKHDAVNVKMPTQNILKFKNVQNTVECPIKITFDFESFLDQGDKVCGKTILIQKHIPLAFCIYVVSRVDGFSMDPITYVSQDGEDVAKVFVKILENIVRHNIYTAFKDPKKMIYNEEVNVLCYLCSGEFVPDSKDLCKVRDHCHYSGKYRGALHSSCTLQLKRSRAIPAFAHNLSG